MFRKRRTDPAGRLPVFPLESIDRHQPAPGLVTDDDPLLLLLILTLFKKQTDQFFLRLSRLQPPADKQVEMNQHAAGTDLVHPIL